MDLNANLVSKINSQRDNCKLRWNSINGNVENNQVKANMKVVHNILNSETVIGKGTYVAPMLVAA